jgi:hypothetical protein
MLQIHRVAWIDVEHGHAHPEGKAMRVAVAADRSMMSITRRGSAACAATQRLDEAEPPDNDRGGVNEVWHDNRWVCWS